MKYLGYVLLCTPLILMILDQIYLMYDELGFKDGSKCLLINLIIISLVFLGLYLIVNY